MAMQTLRATAPVGSEASGSWALAPVVAVRKGDEQIAEGSIR